MIIAPRHHGVGYPPWNLDFPILHKPWFYWFWDPGSITIFFAVKFREEWSNREVCSLHTSLFQSIFGFCINFLAFHGGFNPPWIRLGSNPASWGRVPPVKTGSEYLYDHSIGSPPHGHFALHTFHGVDFNGGTLPHASPWQLGVISLQSSARAAL